MTDSETPILNVPVEKSVRYGCNFIRTAVCEFRFPTLLELEEKPPVRLQSALRKKYPHFRREQGVSLRDAAATPIGPRYLFESKKRNWTISLRASAVSIETSQYTEFEEFINQVGELLGSVRELIDTDFFTRVGLRYINVIPIEDGVFPGWINDALVAPLLTGNLGTLGQFKSEMTGMLHNGQYQFKHGFSSQRQASKDYSEYYLDFDYFLEGVEYDAALGLITEFHDINFSFFRWAIGDKAKQKLGDGTPKGGN